MLSGNCHKRSIDCSSLMWRCNGGTYESLFTALLGNQLIPVNAEVLSADKVSFLLQFCLVILIYLAKNVSVIDGVICQIVKMLLKHSVCMRHQ